MAHGVEAAGPLDRGEGHVGVVDFAEALLELGGGHGHRREVGGEGVAEELGRVTELLVGDPQVMEGHTVVGRRVSLTLHAAARFLHGAARELRRGAIAVGVDGERR